MGKESHKEYIPVEPTCMLIPSGGQVDIGHVTAGQGSGVGQVDGGGHVTSGHLSQVQVGGGGHVTSGQISQVQGCGVGHVAGAVVVRVTVSVRELLLNKTLKCRWIYRNGHSNHQK